MKYLKMEPENNSSKWVKQGKDDSLLAGKIRGTQTIGFPGGTLKYVARNGVVRDPISYVISVSWSY